MNKISILIVLFLLSGSFAQERLESKSTHSDPLTHVRVTVSVQSKPENQGNIFDLELIREVSEQKPLLHMEATYNKGVNFLLLVLSFRDIDEFYEWYRSKEVRNLFDAVTQKLGLFEIKMDFTKTGN